jgi:integrase/recombinase XerD
VTAGEVVSGEVLPRPTAAAAVLGESAAQWLTGLETRVGDNDRWNLTTSTLAWLAARRSSETRRAYAREILVWFTWCERTGLDPRDCRRGDVDAWDLEVNVHLAQTSRARRLSTLSSWYRYLMSNEVVTRNPVDAVDRPRINRDASTTMGLSDDQLTAFVRAARRMEGPSAARHRAVAEILAELGLRVSEAIGLDIADLGYDKGHRTMQVRGKGGKARKLPIPAPADRAITQYLAERAEAAGVAPEQLHGALLVTRTGRRLDQPSVFRLVRRIGLAAGIPDADRLATHGLRHVQDMLGHADPRTTRRYDRNRNSLDRSPTYAIAGLFAESPE